MVQNPSADRCLSLQFAAAFFLQPAMSTAVWCSDLPGRSRAEVTNTLPDPLEPGPRRNPMNTMAPTRPSELQISRVRLTAGPTAAAEARTHVRAAIVAWDVPV